MSLHLALGGALASASLLLGLGPHPLSALAIVLKGVRADCHIRDAKPSFRRRQQVLVTALPSRKEGITGYDMLSL